MTTDERAELLRDAESLAYAHIRFSGLYRELTEDGWERLAREHGEKVIELLESLVNERFTQIESEKQIRRADASSYFAPMGRYWRIGGDY